ncbi:restriction endonuclease subunit S [Streptococcus lutetiensis]|uniref:restriction endonuclease subunit S n=1 Tax=Streptococcus lutetiensis TaxID=150055 RepID=UPI001BD93BA9|nr:restriction endonuclease subunit S [Streptococcus lutetiensis]MBT0891569.1 restriction endonuclease subunit S [Streptococcus lutetiensis]MBT0902675.1 restriction endonuclease subunit S [Streptococcus lutetiensis]
MTNKVPNIRFKGFTDDWEQRKLGEITERVQGNDGRMDLPTLTISAANGWMDQKERFSGNIAGKEQKNYTLLHKGELSYNHGNSKLAKYGAVFSLETYEEALVPRVYHSFKVINGSPKFIEYYFATKIPDRELAKLVSSGARMDGLLNINFNEFMGINLTVPNKSEQEKISNYFSNLDRLITLHQRKCEQTKELKKFMLQKMFPKKGEKNPEIRFSGFTDDWEQRKFGEMFARRMERNNGEFDNTKWISVARMYYQTPDKVTSNNIDTRTYVMRKGDIAFEGHSNSEFKYGRFVANDIGDGVISELFPIYKHIDKYDLNYWKYAIQLESLMQSKLVKCIEISYTSSNKLDKDSFLKEKIPVASLAEQQKIGEYFSNLDHLITLHQRKCEQLKELKKFMLQNMFPKKG